MLTDVQPDALYVATPPGAHLEVIRKIVAAPSASTLKAVYIEKPCGRCAWETRALIYDTTKHKVLSSIVSLAHERTQMIRELLQSQMIGDRVTKVQYTQRGTSFARGSCFPETKCPTIWWRPDNGYGMSHFEQDGLSVWTDCLCQGYSNYVSMEATIGECTWAVIPSLDAKVECLWDFSPAKESNGKSDVDELIIEGTHGSLKMYGMGAGLPVTIFDSGDNIVQTLEFDPPEHAAQPLIQSVVDELLVHNGGIGCPATAENTK
ncbi:hypothetical protein ACHAXN_004020 [Cyclotella atomus]